MIFITLAPPIYGQMQQAVNAGYPASRDSAHDAPYALLNNHLTHFKQLNNPVLTVTYHGKQYQLADPVYTSRSVKFRPETQNSNAYKLNDVKNRLSYTAEASGCCNVNVLEYCPHKITHLETAAHVMALKSNPPTAMDIPEKHLHGVAYLMDFSDLQQTQGTVISEKQIREKLQAIEIPVSLLAIKTPSSGLPEHYDFSGEDFLALSEGAAQTIHDFKAHSSPVNCLIVDLPSVDPEHDDGKLLAHRAYFGLPREGFSGKTSEKRALVELAWMPGLEAGYYYVTVAPARFQANAVHTQVVFRKMTQTQ